MACNDNHDGKINYMPDKPTIISHLGIRFFYTFAAWLILGYNIIPGQGFFTSLMLFDSALLMDYLKFAPNTTLRNWLKGVGIIFSSVGMLVSILGLIGILTVFQIGDDNFIRIAKNFIVFKGQQFNVVIIWYTIAINVALTAIDWLVYESPIEAKLIKDIHTKKGESL